MPALPLVLAGPIVRRAEVTGCSFWIALSEAAEVAITLWQNSQSTGNFPSTISGSALTVPQMLGTGAAPVTWRKQWLGVRSLKYARRQQKSLDNVPPTIIGAATAHPTVIGLL